MSKRNPRNQKQGVPESPVLFPPQSLGDSPAVLAHQLSWFRRTSPLPLLLVSSGLRLFPLQGYSDSIQTKQNGMRLVCPRWPFHSTNMMARFALLLAHLIYLDLFRESGRAQIHRSSRSVSPLASSIRRPGSRGGRLRALHIEVAALYPNGLGRGAKEHEHQFRI